MGKATDRINDDANEGDDNFTFAAGSNANNGTAAACRGFRAYMHTVMFARNDGDNLTGRVNMVASYPGNDCAGDNETTVNVTPMDLPADDDATIYVFIGVGNSATGGGESKFAAQFKVRIR
jgi:flagellar basal body rod protein FlgF